jgi:hypothetical protein
VILESPLETEKALRDRRKGPFVPERFGGGPFPVCSPEELRKPGK